MYGQPDALESYPNGGIHISSGQTITYPFEHWRYNHIESLGENVVFDFVDPARTGEYRLAELNIRPIGWAGLQSNLVDEVWIRGNRRIPSETIQFRLQTKSGQQLDLSAVNSDVQTLNSLGYFDDVRVNITGSASGGSIVMFDVRESALVRTIAYRGIQSITLPEIQQRLGELRTGLTTSSAYSVAKATETTAVLKAMLVERGRTSASVDIVTTPIPPNSVDVVFLVDERVN
jgi:outer membrane protein assembly factor BamA